jgi:hypothetical protein
MPNDPNSNFQNQEKPVSVIAYFNLEFVSDFEFRYSAFKKQ